MDFLELACRAHGFSVDRYTKMPPMDASYFLVFWDKDSVPASTFLPSNLITVSSLEGEEARSLLWPISLAKLDEILFSFFGQPKSEPSATTEENTVTLYHKEGRQILFADCLLTLSEYEMRLLERLCLAKGDVVRREELNRLLGAERGNIADVYVCHLRRKLEKISEKNHIQTVRGVGYRTELCWIEQ